MTRPRNKPRTLTQLIKEKKDLIRHRDTSPEYAAELNQAIEQVESKILARVNQNDQNFLRTFFKTAKELLDQDDFNRIEGVASTRQHTYATSQRWN